MKRATLLFLAVLLFARSSFSQSPPEPPELKEASDLAESVAKLYDEKKFDEALPLAKRALQIREKLLPISDPRVSASLNYLGNIYLVKGDYRAAEQTFERLLQSFEERFGPTAVNLAATLDRLAMLYNRDGKVDKAEKTYQRALALREKEYGPDSVKIAGALFALGQFYRRHEDFDKALPFYKRALSIHGKVSGVNSPEFDHASMGVACLAYDSSNDKLFNEVNEIRSRFAPAAPEIKPEEVLNGKALYLERPEYPRIAVDQRLTGRVIVQVIIDETGKVISATDMCQGPQYLSEAAVKAAWKSRFAPTALRGTPVKVRGVIQYNFRR